MPLASLDIAHLPVRLRELLEMELDGEEDVLWIGRPRLRWFLLRSIPLFSFGVFWTAFITFAVFGTAMQGGQADNGGGEMMLGLFAIPFLLIGLGLLSSPWLSVRRAKRTVYAITSRRAISVNGRHFSTSIHVFDPRRMQQAQYEVRADGSGNLIFFHNEQTREALEVDGSSVHYNINFELANGFFAIPNVRDVAELAKKVAPGEA